jgi:uncharacterized protein (TIGR00106 family)
MIIGELSIFPLGEGVSVSRYVKKVLAVIEDSGFTFEKGAMSTTIETPDMTSLMSLVENAYDVLRREGTNRIIINLKIDARIDKEATISSKTRAIE